MGYEIVLREVHELELSSRCNLACVYCPHSTMKRLKEDMSWAVFDASMRLVDRLCREGTQTELSLTGIGEALLHPDFPDMARLARRVIGRDRIMTLASNGIAVDERIADLCKELEIIVWISLHRPEVAAPAYDLLQRRGVVTGHNDHFVWSGMDWAGQVEWPVLAQREECQYMARGWGVVRVDGQVTTCCMDAHSKHTFGTVWSDPADLVMRPHALCMSCHLVPPKESQHA